MRLRHTMTVDPGLMEPARWDRIRWVMVRFSRSFIRSTSPDAQDRGESSSHGETHVNVRVNNVVLCINTVHLSGSKCRERNNETERRYLSCLLDVIRICKKCSFVVRCLKISVNVDTSRTCGTLWCHLEETCGVSCKNYMICYISS